MTEKISIQPLPVTEEHLPTRRIVQPRGELALIEHAGEFKTLTYFSIRKGAGYFRGAHYHRKKLEHLYIIAGRLRLVFVDLDSAESSDIEVKAGNKITIHPGCAHRLDALDEAVHVLEYFDMIHDPADDYPFQPLLP